MKIVFLTRSMKYGGAERQLILLARGLRRKGYRLTVVLLYPSSAYQNELMDADVPLQIAGKKGRWDILGFLMRLIRILKREDPDVLFGYLSAAHVLSVLLRFLFPKVRVIWTLRASNVNPHDYDRFQRLTSWLETKLAKFAALIIVNSNAGFEHAVAKGFPENKMVVVHNGFDTEHFQPDPESGRTFRGQWRMGPEKKWIGLVARLDPMKDHETFLRAAALVLQERADVGFVCVGDAPEARKAKLQELASGLGLAGALLWTGPCAGMRAAYNALDILCSSSSRGEGFSNAIGEAMACGVPCVVTDVGDSAFIVGDCGLVVPPENPERLALACLEALELDRADSGHRSRLRIIEKFGMDRLVVEMEEACSRVVAGPM